MTAPLNRRTLLGLGASLGVSVSFLGTQAFAASEGDLARKKLVVIICRGGMDGLSERKTEIVQLGMKAILAGTFATCLCGAIVGVLA